MKNKQRFFSFFLAGVFTLFFSVLSILVNSDFLRQYDYQSMMGIQKISSAKIDYLFSFFTLVASSEATLIIVSLIFIFLYLKNKNLIFSIYLYILIYPIELLGKLLIYHPVPPITLNRYVFDFRLPSSFIVVTNYSFPSGHMARSAFLVSLLFFLIRNSKLKLKKKKIIYVLLFLYLILMFVSRIYLGEHWLSDVLGGTLLGFAVGFIAQALW